MGVLQAVWLFVRGFFAGRAAMAAENLALRHQLAVLHRSAKRPKLRTRDRIFWVWLSRLWSGWRSALALVQPETVVGWHRQGFKLYWRWKSRKKRGRPPVDREIRDLIRRMSRENPTWGAPRILSELLMLDHSVVESTVAKYMVRNPKPPSQTWRTFLTNHAGQIASTDFFTVPTVAFRVLYVFLVLRHDRRRVVHFNVTAGPTAQWTARQITEAFPFDQAPRFLLRDRDGIYGQDFRDRVKHTGIEEVFIAFRSPWQSPYVERLIGSIRRECLDHVIVFGEEHLRRVLSDYFAYHHQARLHLSLERNPPIPRSVCPPEQGKVVAQAYLGGLHHCYTRAAQRPASALPRPVHGGTLRHARDWAIAKHLRHPRPLEQLAQHGCRTDGQSSQTVAFCSDDLFGRDRSFVQLAAHGPLPRPQIQLAQRTASDTITVKAPRCSRAQRDLEDPGLIALSERKQLRNEKTRFLQGFGTGLDGAVDYPFVRVWHWPNRPAQPHHGGNDWCRQPGT